MNQDITKQLKEHLRPNSFRVYLNILNILKKSLSPEIDSIEFLYDTDKVIKFLKERYGDKNTKLYVSYIIGSLSIIKPKSLKHYETITEYKNKIKTI